MLRRSLIGLAAVVLLAAAPVASAAQSRHQVKYVPELRVAGTHGYKVDIASDPEGENGPTVFVEIWNGHSETTYVAPGQVGSDGYSASFGPLGWVDLHFERERPREVKSCFGEYEEEERGRFTGTIEFHGERRFTEVDDPWLDTGPRGEPHRNCARIDEGGAHGATLEGVSRWGITRVIANGPGGRVRFDARAENEIGSVKIDRFIQAFGPAEDFIWSPQFRSARVTPPAPFHGSANYHAAHEFGRWRGNLSVDFPGFPRYPLAKPPRFAILKPGGCKVRGSHLSVAPIFCL